jgi:sensor histidine kinase YesM
MHPVIADRRRFALYLLAWMMLGVLLAILAMEPGRIGLRAALLVTLPPTLFYAFVCLAAWYPVRALPLDRAGAWTLLATHALAAVVVSSVWLIVFRLWAGSLDSLAATATDMRIVESRTAVFYVVGALLYLLSVAFHYLLIGLENARHVQQQRLEVRVLAREAELKALKAQLDPHFLFNALNSISSLCGSNPNSARTLTTLLAEYLRKSLRIGTAEAITLSEELELVSSYLAIERIRFGPRLELEQDVDESARAYRVPPLLLQPLVENAVTHGIGNLLEGGVVRLAARRDGNRVQITVENRCDPDRPSRPGTGIGLANTRRRVATFYGDSARVEVEDEPERFRVTLVLPNDER